MTIRCFQLDGHSVAAVDDQGQCLPIEESERIFERFVRIARQTRDSVGLRLYIARRWPDRWPATWWRTPPYRIGARFVLSFSRAAGLS